MWKQGRKSKRTYFWMADEDISDFSQDLTEAMPDLQWQCYDGKPKAGIHWTFTHKNLFQRLSMTT